MKQSAALLLAIILLSPVTTLSQKRRRTSRTPTRPSATPQRTTLALRAGKTRVANQVKKLTHFTYLLGGVAKSIEQTDLSISRNQAPPAIVEQVKRNKATVTTSLRTLREDLDKLEVDFRTTIELQRYYIKLAGSAAGAAAAEDLAAAGQYDRAGRKLLEVVNRLTDVLVEMP
ncbi:MAG TPA: hypothetical protein VIB00_05575 [Pyrinomonadaceae bacterium]